jgi:O-antigen/teichoic acid export membrane protein
VTLATYFAIPVNFGITALAVRDVARDPDSARAVAGEVLALQTALSLLPYLVLLLLARCWPSTRTRAAHPVVGLAFLLEAGRCTGRSTPSQRYVVAAIARLAGAVVYAVLVLALVSGSGDVLELGWIHLAASPRRWRSRSGPCCAPSADRSWRTRLRRLAGRFRAGVPLGVATVMIGVYYTADSLMLGWLKDTATVGQYAVAYKLPLRSSRSRRCGARSCSPPVGAVEHRRGELREQLGFFTSLSLVGSLRCWPAPCSSARSSSPSCSVRITSLPASRSCC